MVLEGRRSGAESETGLQLHRHCVVTREKTKIHCLLIWFERIRLLKLLSSVTFQVPLSIDSRVTLIPLRKIVRDKIERDKESK